MHTVGCHTLGKDVERGTLLGLEVSAESVGSKRSEQWEQLSSALSQLQSVCVSKCRPLLDVRLKSTAVRLDICALWLESWEVSAEKLEPHTGRSQRLVD